ncbi:MAG: hypothetical protein AAF492_04375, partial [Verrucomicrobiota bacterium]
MRKIVHHLLLVGFAVCASAEVYEVEYRDGHRISGDRLSGDSFLVHGRSSVRLDEQPIVPDGREVQRFRQRSLEVQLAGPYIECLNGDLLPGTVVALEPSDPSRNRPRCVEVEMIGLRNYTSLRGATIRVRADRIVRIVSGPESESLGHPGSIRLKTGETVQGRAFRWRSSGLRVLTPDGIQSVSFDNIAELHQPVSGRTRRMLAARREVHFSSDDRWATILTGNGARLTARESKLVRYSWNLTMVQPAWALDAIMIGPEEVAEILYGKADEIPLTALPAEQIGSGSLVGPVWTWTPNRNLRNGLLDLGRRSSRTGVGMHAYTAVAFDLPAEAESFD